MLNAKNDLINPKIYGVEENLLDAISSEFYLDHVNPDYKYESLNTGQKNIIKAMNKASKNLDEPWKQVEVDPF